MERPTRTSAPRTARNRSATPAYETATYLAGCRVGGRRPRAIHCGPDPAIRRVWRRFARLGDAMQAGRLADRCHRLRPSQQPGARPSDAFVAVWLAEAGHTRPTR